MFVGAKRRELVDSLLTDLSRVAGTGQPALVTLVAVPGAGKTKIVQEFYRALAARQPAPAYWPADLVSESADNGVQVSELTAGRKTVRYRGSFAPPAGAGIPWLWLAPAAGRLSDGSPAPAFDGIVSQLRPHVAALAGRPAAAAQGDAISSAVTDLTAGTDQSEERPGQLAGLLSRLLPAAGVPAILILDDAHELDEITTRFVRDLLVADLPVLVIATTWPDELAPVDGRALSPFCEYVAAADSGQIRQSWLGRLAEDDLIGYIVDQFPATDQRVAAALAGRADGNPYALRLLLNLPRVSSSVRGGAIALDPQEIAELNGRLDTLLAEHWAALPLGIRQVLVAAALLGQSFVDEVLEAGLRRLRPQAGLDDALDSAWIRQLGSPDRLLEFAERLRYDLARGAVPDFLSEAMQADICRAALRALRQLLPAKPDGTVRIVLLALHVWLAREGIEDDLAAAAASAAELADRARSELRKLASIEYYKQAVEWTEAMSPVPMRQLVDHLVNYSAVNRINSGRAGGEAIAERAVKLADQFLDPGDELRIHARYQLARARRRPEDPVAYASARALLAEVQELLARQGSSSPAAVRDVLGLTQGFEKEEGRFAEATEMGRDLLAFCEEHFGPLHRHTLNALDDLGFCLQRSSGPQAAIPVRRTLLARRVQRFNEADHLQTAGTKNDLAISLLTTRDPGNLDEAEALIEESVTRRSRAFGRDGRSTQGSRSARCRVWMARGLIAEASGDEATARRLFTAAESEARQLCELRKDERPTVRALSGQRHGEALACLRQPEAITVLGDALDLREGQVGQDYTFWDVQECAKSLWWAYQRTGRASEADAVVRSYHFTGDPGDWIPAFVPDMSRQ